LEQTLAMHLRRAYLTMHRHAQSLFEPLGLTADQYVLLRLVGERSGQTQQQLVRRTASDPSTTAAMVKLLERRGLVSRKTHPADRRSWQVSLTASGRKLVDRLARHDATIHQALAAALGSRSLGDTLAALRTIAELPAFTSRGSHRRKSKIA
jgi:DNA-binding MarR family transcriptional regulator